MQRNGEKNMKLIDGTIGESYQVKASHVPSELKHRLEALGLTMDAPVKILHKKRKGAMVILLRGTRFAIGSGIAKAVTVTEVAP